MTTEKDMTTTSTAATTDEGPAATTEKSAQGRSTGPCNARGIVLGPWTDEARLIAAVARPTRRR